MKILPLLLFLVTQGATLAQICDKDKGPSGTIECRLVKGYENQYQWATCMTRAYIQKQGGQIICEGPTLNYCWYHCMLEVHGQETGSVQDDCFCDPYGDSYNPVQPSHAPEPDYSDCNPGTSSFYDIGCYWYRTCLDKKYPCKPSSNAYVIRYAERFCRVAQELSLTGVSKISPDARKWMDGVWKCMRYRSAVLMRDAIRPTCNDIRDKELSDFTSCYLRAGENDGPSVCYLDCWEHYKIFWTIRGTFNKLDTAWESLKGLWNIGAKCTPSKIDENNKCFQRYLKGAMKFLKLSTENLMQRKKRSYDPLSESDVLSRFADRIGSAIASSLKWNKDVMDWIAYTEDQTSLRNLDIVIVLADKKALGIETESFSSLNLGRVVQDFASAVKDDTLRLQVSGYNVWVKSLRECNDKSCRTTQKLAGSSNPPWNGGTRTARISPGFVGLCVSSAAWIMLKDKMFF